jgi:hypothetical protein
MRERVERREPNALLADRRIDRTQLRLLAILGQLDKRSRAKLLAWNEEMGQRDPPDLAVAQTRERHEAPGQL